MDVAKRSEPERAFLGEGTCWRRALVYGMGASGAAATRALLGHGIEVLAVDDRAPDASAPVEVIGAAELRELPADVDVVVKSPGVPRTRPLVLQALERSLPVIGEVELAFRWLEGDLIGITGSNGKSTTTYLVGEMLRAEGRAVEVCGNFGPPLCQVLDGPPKRVFVTELSSFQLEDCVSLRPVVGALLNLAPDHLDRHGDLERYGAAKARLFACMGAGDVAVLNEDDPWVSALELPAGVRRRSFSRRRDVADGCHLQDDREGRAHVVEVAPGAEPAELFAVSDLPLAGLHNLENAMAAALIARSYGARREAVRAGLASASALPHRMQPIAELRGVVYYDDSKGTNPAATASSLAGFEDGTVRLICGGRAKGGSFSSLRDAVARKVAKLYLIGEAAPELEREFSGLVPTAVTHTLAAAVRAAAAEARPGEVVLLSPACASFDQFRDFVDRGEAFERLVRELEADRG